MFLSFFVSTVFDFIHWYICIFSNTNVWFSIHNLFNYHLIVACLFENNTHSFFSNQDFNGCVVQDICMFQFHVIFCGATGLTGFTHSFDAWLSGCMTFDEWLSFQINPFTVDLWRQLPLFPPPSFFLLPNCLFLWNCVQQIRDTYTYCRQNCCGLTLLSYVTTFVPLRVCNCYSK